MARRDEDGIVDGVTGAGAAGAARGRGAAVNPGTRFETTRLTVLGEFLDHDLAERRGEAPPHPASLRSATLSHVGRGGEGEGEGSGAGQRAGGPSPWPSPGGRGVKAWDDESLPLPVLPTHVYDDSSKTVINRVDSPDLHFNWTINPYRGCEHGCVYCYARPTHETLGWSCGIDFETRIMAKRDAAALLARELDNPKWVPETIMMSGVTDPYQPVERDLRIARACLEVMAARNQPVAIVTKNRLVTRDIDLLSSLARVSAAGVAVSLTTLDREVARKMEPRASTPQDRLRAMRELSEAGIPVTVMTAPVVPGLTDHELPRLLEAAAEAGATSAGWVMLRLPYQIKDVFLDWLSREFPERAKRVESAVRGMRGGDLYDSRWRTRQRGEGPLAEQIGAQFRVFTKRHGLDKPRPALSGAAFRRGDSRLQVRERAQLALFERGAPAFAQP